MKPITLLHNPRCSKSRQALQLLQANGIQPNIRLYLENPLNVDEIETLLKKLGLSAEAVLRKKEPSFRALGMENPHINDRDRIQAMASCPQLIERPIAVCGDHAIIGRPPETILELI